MAENTARGHPIPGYPATVCVLGTEYALREAKPDDDEWLGDENDGYCSEIDRTIVIVDLHERKGYTEEGIARYRKRLLRHEVLHAVTNECGLSDDSLKPQDVGWARNEEMVDWFAIMYPRIKAIYASLGIEDDTADISPNEGDMGAGI